MNTVTIKLRYPGNYVQNSCPIEQWEGLAVETKGVVIFMLEKILASEYLDCWPYEVD